MDLAVMVEWLNNSNQEWHLVDRTTVRDLE